jgi:hypothetical protein
MQSVWAKAVALVTIGGALVLTGPVAGTARPDISACADELERLAKISAKAATTARLSASADTRLDSTLQSERRECGLWGLGEPKCEAARESHRDAVRNLDQTETAFRYEYVSLQARISGTQSSCGAYGTAPVIPGVAERNREACLVFQSFRDAPLGLVPKLNTDCRSFGLSEDECRICLIESYRPK